MKRGLAVLAAAGLAAACGSPPASLALAADPRDLAAASARAAESIRRRQAPDGHWATDVTPGPVFRDVGAEVNVFTPAVIVDLLDPVAREVGLARELDRARGYLQRQIETTGLVRYHGDQGPVAPARRGCEIPPDVDDTALVWRIAPHPDGRLLAAARGEIDRYRDASGLYRTWIADDDAYRCFHGRFAGREWNPPDVAVEMHVYLFLSGHDSEAAARLCEALRRRIDDDGIWVWYTAAPLLPLLREADLAGKGCALRVPRARLERAVAGQEVYLTQARLLQSLLLGERARDGVPVSPGPFLKALREAAADGFARLSRTPPLLYHNDLSATPPHYHWSVDFGLALWLRLYAETARRFPGSLPPPGPPAPGG